MPLELGILLILALSISVLIYAVNQEKRKVRALQLSDIDNMAGHQFEHYVAKLLSHQGFQTTVTVSSGDLGIDVIARKGPTRYAIQVKRQQQNVSRRAVSDAVAGRIHYKCTDAMVVTNAFYTAGAQELAKTTRCRLVDRNELTQWILSFQQSEMRPNPSYATHPAFKRPNKPDMREYLDFDGEDYFLRNPGPVVYMIAHGDREGYKIGFTKDINARVDKIDLQMPEKVWVVHKIYTNDPKWLEQIWHKRFAIKGKNGEWFDLLLEDIADFKKHRECNNSDLDCKSQILLPIESNTPSSTKTIGTPVPRSVDAQDESSSQLSAATQATIERVKNYFETLKRQHPKQAQRLDRAWKYQVSLVNADTKSDYLSNWEDRAKRSADAKVR